MSKSFLQSQEWAKFQESLGRKVFIIKDKLVIKYGLPLGLSYLYSPRPNFNQAEISKKFLREARKIARAENAIFLRIEPDLKSCTAVEQWNPSTGLRAGNLTIKQCSNIQPANTLVLDLTKPLCKLLEEMHPKTRYNIRLAQRHNLKIKKSVDVNDVDIFWQLALKTSRRDGFSYHPKYYYQKMMETLGRENKGTKGLRGKSGNKRKLEVVLFIAKQSRLEIEDPRFDESGQFNNLTLRLHSGQAMVPLAAILVLFYQDTAIYLHGASDHAQRKYMAPFLLQWQAIKEAKKRGCKIYDFWGIAPRNSKEILNPKSETLNPDGFYPIEDPRQSRDKLKIQNSNIQNNVTMEQWNNGTMNQHPWAGITRFKTGFAQNGKIINYPSCYDIIYQRFWYLLYELVKKFRS